jgi:hypothetical protein
MATIKKKAQAGTAIRKNPPKAPRDISDAEFKKYGNTESQLAGKKTIKVETQKNTPLAFVDYKALAAKKQLTQKKYGGKVKKAPCAGCGKSVKKGKK